jgi:hypothetical protein
MTNWSAIDPNSVGGRLLRLPVRMLPKSAVMTIRRGPAKGMKWIVGAATHGCWLGTYELDKQKSIQKFVRPGMIAYDVGAQAGFYTLILSRLVGDQGRVFAFEPNARELTYLIRHVSLNRLRNVEIVQAAVGEKTGTVPFTIDRGVTQNAIAERGTGVTVAVLALKMDIEGGESAALRGARRLLQRSHPIAFVALHGPSHREFCPKFLRSLGYGVYDLNGKTLAETTQCDEICARCET